MQLATETLPRQTGNDRGNIETEGNIRRRKEGDVFGELCSNGDVTNTNRAGGRERLRINGDGKTQNEGRRGQPQSEFGKDSEVSSDTMCRRQSCEKHGQEKPEWITENGIPNDWQNFPTVPPLCDRDDGLSDRLFGITFSKWRNESIKAMGNAIVPEVAYQIFKAMEQYKLKTN